MIGESAQQKKYKVVSLENPIVKVLLHERYSVALLRAVVVGMFKAFSYKGSSCSKVSILVSRYMLFKHCTSERCPMMYAPAGSVIDFVPRFHEFMTETLYVSSELQYCFPRSLFYCVIPIRSNYDCNRNIYTWFLSCVSYIVRAQLPNCRLYYSMPRP